MLKDDLENNAGCEGVLHHKTQTKNACSISFASISQLIYLLSS